MPPHRTIPSPEEPPTRSLLLLIKKRSLLPLTKKRSPFAFLSQAAALKFNQQDDSE
ncbi:MULTISPECIES: hypothetical protein [Microcystis]|uniref:hypothetical protein n=1 Tax=Microcystis TaxID=1125 RepID=UPI00030ED722|nr:MULTISPECIES: hypothetical protein [Microcystis]